MSATKWTPGPWLVDAEYPDDVRSIHFGLVAQAYVVPVHRGGGEMRKSNAQLVAAAPDLYAALEGMREAMRSLGISHNEAAEPMMMDAMMACDAADAALSKARGEA